MTTEIQKLRARLRNSTPGTQYLRMTIAEATALEAEILALENQQIATVEVSVPQVQERPKPQTRLLDGGTF